MAVGYVLKDLLVLILCAFVHFVYRYHRKPRLPLPPGIPQWPMIGNALSLPLSYAHVFYKNLADQLGSKIMHVRAFGRDIVVLNDIRMAQELLEKRSGLYSSRPELVMITEVINVKTLFGAMPYGDTWRGHRRLFQQHFSPKNMDKIQERELEFIRKCLLPNIYLSPGKNIREHLRDFLGGLSTSITYGLPTKRTGDPLVHRSEEVWTSITQAAAPGKYLVNIIAPLKHVPEWVPGAGFQKIARQVRERLLKLMDDPYQETLKSIDEGSSRECFVAESMERHRNQPNFDIQAGWIKEAGAQIFGAAAETTVAATTSFILAMLLHPDVQLQVQKEIDTIVEPDRLPDFSDAAKLPYLSAVIKEVLRWNPIAPMGLPHLTTAEDVYRDYYIPKGTTIMTNIYAMLHDEEIFPSPKKFDPTRFFKDGRPVNDIPNPEVFATFGFGRRICPGSHIALATLYTTAVSILSLFDILPMLDDDGVPIKVVPEFTGESVVSDPLPFPCVLVPRKGKDVGSLLGEYLDAEVI